MKTVLVVDDTEDTRELLAYVLETEGYRAVSASDGQEALEVLEHTEPEPCLILLDWMMPVMDGQTFLQELEQNQHRRVPVVVVSAVAGLMPMKGVRRIFPKPIPLGELRDTLHELCESR